MKPNPYTKASIMPGFLRKYADRPAFSLLLPAYLVTALALCVLLQLQLTFFRTDDYLGLRLNAADLLLPILGGFILTQLFLKKDEWPQWRVPHMYLWLAGLTLVMSYALYNGYQTTGSWDRWALINKYAGWYILLAYMGIGGWIGSHPAAVWGEIIIPAFSAIWAATMIGTMAVAVWLDVRGDMEQLLKHYPLAGFMGNRNAYAYLSYSVISMITALQIRQKNKPSWYFYVLWALIPFFYSYNASRVALAVLPFMIVAFLLIKPEFTCRRILPSLAAGVLLALLFFNSFNSHAFYVTRWHTNNAGILIENRHLPAEEIKEKTTYAGDKVRSETYSDALALWRQRPVTGSGLGAFRAYQMETRGQFSDVIDCTPLWLLAETGMIGLGAFAALFTLALWRIFSKIKAGGDPYGIYLGIFMTLIIFAIMSAVHELLYTRFLWLFIGLALALPPEERPPKRRRGG